MHSDDPKIISMSTRFWILCPVLTLAACAPPTNDDWPPAPIEASDDIIQLYVDRYALKEQTPRVYSDIELKALQILQERRRYESTDPVRGASRDSDEDNNVTMGKERSRAQINAIKRKVYRKHESAHDRRHELRSKYGL
jgi:hypothetical protein